VALPGVATWNPCFHFYYFAKLQTMKGLVSTPLTLSTREQSLLLQLNMRKKPIIMFVFRGLVLLLEFCSSIIGNLGKLLRLKRGRAISIERMAGKSVGVGS